MRETNDSVPVNWAELVGAKRDSAEYAQQFMYDEADRITLGDLNSWAPIFFSNFAESLCLIAVVLGPIEGVSIFNMMNETLQTTLSEISSEISSKNRLIALGLLNYVNAARCYGIITPPEAVSIEQSWLPQLAGHRQALTDTELHTLGLAALAANQLTLVPQYVGGGALPERFEPAQTFQFNVPGYIRYIAAAMEQHAGPDDIEAAWFDFVERFPRKLAAETLGWVDLMWAARTMMTHFEKRPVETVAEWLHKLVT